MSYGSFASNYNNPLANLGKNVANAESGMAGLFGKFRNNRVVGGTSDFLQSNSLVAKVCFLILVIIIFIIAVKLGTRFLQWVVTPTGSPILINGLRDGKKMAIIEQDPRIPGSIPIQRSVNEREGIEFTWSVWLFLDHFLVFSFTYYFWNQINCFCKAGPKGLQILKTRHNLTSCLKITCDCQHRHQNMYRNRSTVSPKTGFKF